MTTMNYDRFLSAAGKETHPQVLRQTQETIARSGLAPSQFINMAGGLPNPALFPFVSAEFKLRDGSTLTLDEENMAVAMQYGATSGHPAFVKKVKDLLQKYHNPPISKIPRDEGGFDLCIIPGAQAGLQMTFKMLMNPGDYFIVEEPTYVGAFAATRPIRCNPLSVATDDKGMIPSELRKLLERWGPSAAKDPKSDIPKLIYLIPTGTNPSGVTISEQRRREIYQVAREYDLIILEDDPYFFINFADERPPSFLSLDEDGRVIRVDSFSKIIAAGLRLGTASGPRPLIQRIMWTLQANSGHASCLSQVLVSELLEKWGDEGFEKQMERCREKYREQRDLMTGYANKYLRDLAEWNEPSAGMFFWLKIKGIEDTSQFIYGKLANQRVLFAPGFCFTATPETPCSYMRIAYSTASEEEIDKAFRCLASAIREELAGKKAGVN